MDEPLAIVDVALKLGVRVIIVDAPSLEGMYCHEKNTILISRHRSAGRRAFTCAHEVGHWHFGHGTSVDDLTSNLDEVESTIEERLANAFAQYILLPPNALRIALSQRNLTADSLTPEDCFIISTQFGVAYAALLASLRFTAGKITRAQYDKLNVRPKLVRLRLTGGVDTRHLIIVDDNWGTLPVDLEVGDHLMAPATTTATEHLLSEPHTLGNRQDAILFRAETPGTGMLQVPTLPLPLTLRVAPEAFAGFAENRFLSS